MGARLVGWKVRRLVWRLVGLLVVLVVLHCLLRGLVGGPEEGSGPANSSVCARCVDWTAWCDA